MNYLNKIQAGVNFIEANLDVDIPLAKIAREVGLSQWHFQRIFKALTNETLKTYIRSRRLANSLNLLLTTNFKVLDIALCAGYESQESFTRAFKVTFGLTPNSYRKLGDKSMFLKKVEFDLPYLKHINQSVSLTPEVYTQDTMHLVGLRTSFYSVDSEKNNIGEKLPALWANFLERIDEIQNTVSGICYGVVQQVKEDTDQLEYYAAMEVSMVNALPEMMVKLDVKKSCYAKFTHKGNAKNIDNTVNYIYSNWLLQSDSFHTSGPDLEIYNSDYNPISDESVMYYAIPIV